MAENPEAEYASGQQRASGKTRISAHLTGIDVVRAKFNASSMEADLDAGRLREKITKSGPPRKSFQFPPGTLSQMVDLINADGIRVAEVHRYLLPDGTLGASGRLDPHGVLEGNVYYYYP
jgi:hypothetical protein